MLRRLRTFARMTWQERRERLAIYGEVAWRRSRFTALFLVYLIPAIVLVAVGVRFLPTHTIRHFGNLVDVPAVHVRAR